MGAGDGINQRTGEIAVAGLSLVPGRYVGAGGHDVERGQQLVGKGGEVLAQIDFATAEHLERSQAHIGDVDLGQLRLQLRGA